MTPGSTISAQALLPSSFSPLRLTARQLLAASGGLGCASWSLAGLYPQFDGGSLRVVLAFSSLVFGGMVSVWAVKAQTRSLAFGRALGLAAALGFMSTLLPLAILSATDRGGVALGIFFGAMFGIPTGLFYGVPLGILAAATHRGVNADSRDGTDRAAKAAGFWLAPMALVAIVFSLSTAYVRYAPPTEGIEQLLAATPALLAGLVFLAAVVLVVRAFARLGARRKFVARIAAGEEPLYRIRESVIEWVPDGAAPSAYRAMAQGIPVAEICE